jgi:DNA-binding transcriptional MerR regulator
MPVDHPMPTALLTMRRGIAMGKTGPGPKTNLYVNGKVGYHGSCPMSHLDLPSAPSEAQPRLLRIQEVAATLGLTARTIRYYEELGLLTPAARSEGDYRLYDEDDVERLRFIKGLRDEAGFSLAEISQLLEDEATRTRNRDRYRTSTDTAERRAIVDDALARVDRQIASLRAKTNRLTAMIEDAETRRAHLLEHVRELETGERPAHHATTNPAETKRGALPTDERPPRRGSATS